MLRIAICSLLLVVCTTRRGVAAPLPLRAPATVVMAQVKGADGRGLSVVQDGIELPVYTALAPNDPRTAAARFALTRRGARRVLALLELAKRVRLRRPRPAGFDAGAWRRALASPFFLSVDGPYEERGGFGFVLRTASGDVAHELTPYVELNGTAETIRGPDYEAGVVHETGHAILAVALAQWIVPCWRRLGACGRTPSAFHDVQRATQPIQALSEGFAEHLEAAVALDRDLAEVFGPRLVEPVVAARAFVSPRPRRLDVILWNRAVFEPALPPETAATTAGAVGAHARYQDSQPFDNHRLRTCREMLSTEGVVASLLTHLALRGSSSGFHERLFAVMARLDAAADPALLGELGIREVVASWIAGAPAPEAARIARGLVSVTFGATVSAPAAERLRRLLAVATREPRRGEVSAAAGELDHLAATTQPAALFGACAPPLWVLVKGRSWCAEPGSDACLPMELDLNAATEMDLRVIPGLDAERARGIIAQRDRLGGFASREAFLSAARLPAGFEGIPPQPRPVLEANR